MLRRVFSGVVQRGSMSAVALLPQSHLAIMAAATGGGVAETARQASTKTRKRSTSATRKRSTSAARKKSATRKRSTSAARKNKSATRKRSTSATRKNKSVTRKRSTSATTKSADRQRTTSMDRQQQRGGQQQGFSGYRPSRSLSGGNDRNTIFGRNKSRENSIVPASYAGAGAQRQSQPMQRRPFGGAQLGVKPPTPLLRKDSRSDRSGSGGRSSFGSGGRSSSFGGGRSPSFGGGGNTFRFSSQDKAVPTIGPKP